MPSTAIFSPAARNGSFSLLISLSRARMPSRRAFSASADSSLITSDDDWALWNRKRLMYPGIALIFSSGMPIKVTLTEPMPTISTPSIGKNIARLPSDTSKKTYPSVATPMITPIRLALSTHHLPGRAALLGPRTKTHDPAWIGGTGLLLKRGGWRGRAGREGYDGYDGWRTLLRERPLLTILSHTRERQRPPVGHAVHPRGQTPRGKHRLCQVLQRIGPFHLKRPHRAGQHDGQRRGRKLLQQPLTRVHQRVGPMQDHDARRPGRGRRRVPRGRHDGRAVLIGHHQAVLAHQLDDGDLGFLQPQARQHPSHDRAPVVQRPRLLVVGLLDRPSGRDQRDMTHGKA